MKWLAVTMPTRGQPGKTSRLHGPNRPSVSYSKLSADVHSPDFRSDSANVSTLISVNNGN